MKKFSNSRRTFVAGVIAAIGTGLCARTAFAFPRGTQGLLQAATRLLHEFGVSVAAMFDTESGRDVLRIIVNPRDDIQYDQIVNDPRSFNICWITSSFGDAVEFTNFDMSTGQPNLKTASQGGRSMIEILDPQANVQVMISGGATYELRDGMLVMVN
jgi:hypothetical protein